MLFDDILEDIGEGIFQRFAIAVCGLATVAEAIATASVPFAMMLASCDLKLTLDQMLGLNCTLFAGMAVGGYWLGGVSDVSGRKYILSTTSIITFVGCFVASFAQCIIMLFTSFLILGIGIGGNHTATRLFIIEVIPKSCRGSRLVVLEVFSSVGYIAAIGLTCLLVPSMGTGLKGNYVRLNSWRILFGLSGSLSIFSACLMSVFPASPRWLLGKKQEDDAIDVLRKIYAVNRMKHEESFPNIQLDPIENVNVRNDNALYQCNGHFFRTFRSMRIFTSRLFMKKYLKTTSACLLIGISTFDSLVIMNVWLGIIISNPDVSSCTLAGSSPAYTTNLTEFCPTLSGTSSFEVNVYLSFCSLVVVLLVFPVDKIHRKFILLGSSVITGVSCVALVFSPLPNLRLCFGFLILSFNFVSEVTFRIILLESYPTVFRGTAYGFVKFFARLLSAVLVLWLRGPCVWFFTAIGALYIREYVAGAMPQFAQWYMVFFKVSVPDQEEYQEQGRDLSTATLQEVFRALAWTDYWVQLNPEFLTHLRFPDDASRIMAIKLYSVSDGPPSLAVRMAMKYLGIDYQLVDVDFGAGQHMTEDYAKMNPQKEIPVLDDNGFYLSESNAILQYIADKYPKDDSLYPKDPQCRAVVNHRLAFNLSTYYRYISEYVMAPIFFGYERTPLGLKKVHIALSNFNTYLERLNKRFAAGDHLTIADFQLITATMCLEAVSVDFSKYPKVCDWYSRFKKEYPDLWKITEVGMNEVNAFERNPPDLSHLNHPIHPNKKKTA